jgi:hypothetical protein
VIVGAHDDLDRGVALAVAAEGDAGVLGRTALQETADDLALRHPGGRCGGLVVLRGGAGHWRVLLPRRSVRARRALLCTSVFDLGGDRVRELGAEFGFDPGL